MKGGHVNSGPARDPHALRRDRDGSSWIHLPAAGRQGEPPAWPLSRTTARERVVWAREWTRPQAIEWEHAGLAEEVALYVRCLVRAERPRATAADRTLVRQLMESLGLTVTGLARNRWTIDERPVERASTSTPGATPAEPESVRDRLKLVVGGNG